MEYSYAWPPISTVQQIMENLPDHFTSEAVINVERDVGKEIICQYADGKLMGFIIFEVKEMTAELLWMAVKTKHHGRKYGTSILKVLESGLRERSVKRMILKTLDDSANSTPYHRTTNFYRKNGFRKIRFMDSIPDWGPGNPCALYEKVLK